MEDCELIKNDIINYFGIDFDTSSREQHKWFLRALYYALCRDNTPLSFREIGRTLSGKFHHSSVLNGVQKFHDTIKFYDKEIRYFYESFEMPNAICVRDVNLILGYIKF